ncbi:nucleoid-associated protein [Streptococcus pantholopis]|uniref:Nucleoid-associated protein n=1 Tax=Streptococcus pantholopis TaxID=1811193 RepID=A0A172Q9T4_9STRE|nr:nucleoid-associated protein [Streptococcus pantholopis]AND80192.1 hypothetical protein A0O21_09380 [Streptococcus pantholopis]
MKDTVAVFDIKNSVEKVVLDNEMITNIHEIFKSIIGTSNGGGSHSSIWAEIATEESILSRYSENRAEFLVENFAESLLTAESNPKNGDRKKNIRDGFLFIKESSDALLLLKLEKTAVADTTKFKVVEQLGTEKNYYKACIFPFDFNTRKIEVIDKSYRIANFWIRDFLGLQEVRNSKVNSQDLVEFIENDSLFTEEIRSQENYSEIKKESKNYIFEHETFVKNDFIDFLSSKMLIEVDEGGSNYEKRVFSEITTILDYNFIIDQKVLRERYHGSIEISKETTIKTDNLQKLVNRQAIELDDNKLILTVSDDYVPRVRELLGINNG